MILDIKGTWEEHGRKIVYILRMLWSRSDQPRCVRGSPFWRMNMRGREVPKRMFSAWKPWLDS